MAYTIKVTERLDGMGIANYGNTAIDDFAIINVPLNSAAARYGICVGDALLSLDDKSFSDLTSQSATKDPNCILQDAQLPYNLTLIRNGVHISTLLTAISDQIVIDSMDEDTSAECKENEPENPPSIHPLTPDPISPDSGIETQNHSPYLSDDDEIIISNRTMAFYGNLGAEDSDHSTSLTTGSTTSNSTTGSDSGSDSGSNHRNSSLNSESSETSDSVDSLQSIRAGKEQSDVSKDIISLHFIQKYSLNMNVRFDKAAVTKSNGKMIAISSNPLESGCFEWTLELIDCDVEIQGLYICIR